MNEFPNINFMLRTIFNSEDGLSEDVAIALYKRAATGNGKIGILKDELKTAFGRSDISWKKILLNDEFEVYDAYNEIEARAYAMRIL